MNKRLALTIFTFVVIGIITALAVLMAKGYQLSPQKGKIFTGTGILSVTSIPDQASVYIDGHLTTATNTNINSLLPKKYKVRIVKDGFISWEKEVEVNEGLVTEVKATLFRAIPTVYPLTYNGVRKVLLSPDEQKIVYIVEPPPNEDALVAAKKGGIWVWTMSDQPIAFARGGEPHQIMQYQQGINFETVELKWSPDSASVLVSLPNRHLLLDSNSLNDPPRDISAIVTPTLKGWEETNLSQKQTQLERIKNTEFKKIASNAAFLKWAPDETKILYSESGNDDFKVIDLEGDGQISSETYQIPKAAHYLWLPDSEHLLLIEPGNGEQEINSNDLKMTKISVIEFDGFNKFEIYAGNLDPDSVSVWPDGSRIVIVSYHPTTTASKSNLFGFNLK